MNQLSLKFKKKIDRSALRLKVIECMLEQSFSVVTELTKKEFVHLARKKYNVDVIEITKDGMIKANIMEINYEKD